MIVTDCCSVVSCDFDVVMRRCKHSIYKLCYLDQNFVLCVFYLIFIFLFFSSAAVPFSPPSPYGFFLDDLIHCHDFSYYSRSATLQTANLSQLYPFPRFLYITIYLSYINKPEHFQDLTYYFTPSSKPITSSTFPILENDITVH